MDGSFFEKRVLFLTVFFGLFVFLIMVPSASAWSYGDTLNGWAYDGEDGWGTESVGLEINPNTTLAGVEVDFFDQVSVDSATVKLKRESDGYVLDSASYNGGVIRLLGTMYSGNSYWIVVDGYQSNAWSEHPGFTIESSDFDIPAGVREDGSGGRTGDGQWYIWDINHVTALLPSNDSPSVDSFYPNPHPPNVDEYVDYTVDASDSDGHIDEIELTLYDDGIQVYNNTSYNDSYHTFSNIYTPSSDGQLEADVRVEDDDGSSTNDSITDYVNVYPDFDSASADPSGGTKVGSTSPTLSVDVSDPDGDSMDVSFYDASDDSLIGTDSGVASGGSASVTWSGLDLETSYSWYAVADDGSLTTQSSTWSFNTNYSPNSPSNPSPSDGAVGVSTSPTLSVDVSDPDGDSMDISFYDASDDSLIGTDSGVASGGSASVTWSGLDLETSYSWYAVADDGSLTTQSSTWSFQVNALPTADFSYSISGKSVSVDGSPSSDPEGPITSYEWDWTSDGSYESSGQTSSHTYGSTGDYDVTLRVTDNNGSTDTVQKTVTADTQPPKIENVNTSHKTKSGITISWNTDEEADSLVEFGENENYVQNISSSGDNLEHSLKLTGLNSETTYHYQVKSTDPAGNENISENYEFTTFENSNEDSVSGDSENITVTEPDTGTETTVQFDTTDSSGNTIVGLSENNPEENLPAGKNPVRFVSVSSEISNDNLDNVNITVEYSDNEISGLDESSFTFYYWDEEQGSWQDYSENMTVDTGNNTVTLQTTHFSDYSLTANSTTIGGTALPTNPLKIWLPYLGITVLTSALLIVAILSGKEWLSKPGNE